jgi:hypothetical protein
MKMFKVILRWNLGQQKDMHMFLFLQYVQTIFLMGEKVD